MIAPADIIKWFGVLKAYTQNNLTFGSGTTLTSGTVTVPIPRDAVSAYTLTSTDITNQYVDIPYIAIAHSTIFLVCTGGVQIPGLDFTISLTAGVAGGTGNTGGTGGTSSTRITFAGGLATGGVSALVAGDQIYWYCDSY